MIDAKYLTRFMLLGDLEVARRLFRDEEGKITYELDDLPIGVAIAVINHFMETNPNWHFQMDFIFQIFQDPHQEEREKYEARKNAVKVILEKLAFDSATKAAIGQVRV
jgi:hypothetical protein